MDWFQVDPLSLNNKKAIETFVLLVFSYFIGREPGDGARQVARYFSKLNQKQKGEFRQVIQVMKSIKWEAELHVLKQSIKKAR